MVSRKRLGLSGLVAAAALVFAQPAQAQSFEPDQIEINKEDEVHFLNGALKYKDGFAMVKTDTPIGTVFCYQRLSDNAKRNYVTTIKSGLSYLEEALEILARTDDLDIPIQVVYDFTSDSRWLLETIPGQPLTIVYDIDSWKKDQDVPPAVDMVALEDTLNGKEMPFPEKVNHYCNEFLDGLLSANAVPLGFQVEPTN